MAAAVRKARESGSGSGIARLEGYLLLQAEIGNARVQAEEFARRMPWLTTAQREEIVRLYAQDRVDLSHQVLAGIAGRCRELQEEYADRYARLRRRVLCTAVATVLCVLTVTWTCLLLLGPGLGADPD